MKGLRKAAVAAALAGAGFVGGSAQAADYVVTYTSAPFESPGPGAFSGTLTTTDTADADGYYTVTAINGVRNGKKVTLMPIGSYYGNDNLFKPTDTYASYNGIVFNDGAATFSIYSYGGYYFEDSTIGLNFITTFSVVAVPAAAAVPEPAAWTTMILGVGVIGFALRRRKVTTRISYAA